VQEGMRLAAYAQPTRGGETLARQESIA
jgi:hypothetical protein